MASAILRKFDRHSQAGTWKPLRGWQFDRDVAHVEVSTFFEANWNMSLGLNSTTLARLPSTNSTNSMSLLGEFVPTFQLFPDIPTRHNSIINVPIRTREHKTTLHKLSQIRPGLSKAVTT